MKRILAIALCLALFALPALGEQAPAMPDALAGVWQGEGSDGISLTITLNGDGTGVYEFEQDGYTESLPFNGFFIDELNGSCDPDALYDLIAASNADDPAKAGCPVTAVFRRRAHSL